MSSYWQSGCCNPVCSFEAVWVISVVTTAFSLHLTSGICCLALGLSLSIRLHGRAGRRAPASVPRTNFCPKQNWFVSSFFDYRRCDWIGIESDITMNLFKKVSHCNQATSVILWSWLKIDKQNKHAASGCVAAGGYGGKKTNRTSVNLSHFLLIIRIIPPMKGFIKY